MEIARIEVSGAVASVRYRDQIPAGLVGGIVTVVYSDTIWKGLTKTVVFKGGAETRDVVSEESAVTIPHETVAEPGKRLYVGFYGTDTDGTLVIPTIWADLGMIRDATDPSGDVSTDPSLPVYAQLAQQIGDLRDQVENMSPGSPGGGTGGGQDGFSPIASVAQTADGAVITITDKKGTTTATVKNGRDGDDGGHYTPTVTQPSETTMQIGFTPSKANMPAVQPVKITLPVNPDYGGNVDHVGVEPAEDDIPKVFLTGAEFSNMTKEKNEVKMGLEYISKTDKFKAAIKIKFQGNSSLDYPKKNFTIKMYTDDTYEDKLKKSFKDWNHSGNKYVLKANYIDHAHARNIISANLWSEVVASRPDYDSLPAEMRNSPRNGAIDGFPVKLYVNGTYQGIYTWNIGKDDWMWGMDEDNANHVLMCAETNDNGSKTSTPCNFRALWSGTDENHWTVEVGTNSTAVKTALNNLIQFVMNNDGDDFRNGIGAYLDIQSAIDYYIFMYEVCGLDGLAKNMLLATYDGKLWQCGAYDMDSTFGLFWNGTKFVAATYRCPEDYQETNSLLWERIEANFMPELKARQAELRKTVLSYANIVTHFERFMDVIGLDLYAEDLTIYTGIPSGSTNNIKQIRNYIRDRQAYVDAEFAAMALPVACTGITLNTNTLIFDGEGTQTLTTTVTPDGCTDPVTWESDNTSVATVNGGVVTAIANGSATITAKCGNHSASCSVNVSGIEEGGEDEPEMPVDGVVLYNNYSPNGEKFSKEQVVDLDTHCIEASIDLSSCTGGNENLLSVGANIATFGGWNLHLYYTRSTGVLKCYFNINTSTSNAKDITVSGDNLHIKLNGYGLYINGERVSNDGRNHLFRYLATLDSIQIGSMEGTRSKAHYHYIAVKEENVVSEELVYSISEETVFDGTNYIDTGIKLCEEETDFRIEIEFTNDTQSGTCTVFHCMNEGAAGYPGFNVFYNGTNVEYSTISGNSKYAVASGEKCSLNVDHIANAMALVTFDDENVIVNPGVKYTGYDGTLVLGAYRAANGTYGRFWKGTIHKLNVYKCIVN